MKLMRLICLPTFLAPVLAQAWGAVREGQRVVTAPLAPVAVEGRVPYPMVLLDALPLLLRRQLPTARRDCVSECGPTHPQLGKSPEETFVGPDTFHVRVLQTYAGEVSARRVFSPIHPHGHCLSIPPETHLSPLVLWCGGLWFL